MNKNIKNQIVKSKIINSNEKWSNLNFDFIMSFYFLIFTL